MSHSCHALSDIIIDMSQPPPRNLRCRPIIVQHSAILQPGIPIQVEVSMSTKNIHKTNNSIPYAYLSKQLILSQHSFFYFSQAHISLNGRSANNNNSNDETTESGNQAQSDNAESTTSSRVNTEDSNQERDNGPQSQAERSQQDQGQSPFGTFRFIVIQFL